jgi:phosphate acetyltransferase
MGLMDEIKSKARSSVKRIVLPEGTEERTIKAAEIIAKEGFAVPESWTAMRQSSMR